jgi:hypothetical protein
MLTGKTIGQLSNLNTPTSNTLFPVELSGSTYKTSLSDIKNTISSGSFISQMFMNPQTITENITIPPNYNAFLAGPVGFLGDITIESGSNLSIL